MSNKEKSLKASAINGLVWRFSERVTAQIVSFVVSIVLARILLPEEYGIVAVVTILISLADVFVTHGLGTALVQKKDADELDFNTIFYSGLVLSLVFYTVLFFSAPLVAYAYKNELITPVLRVMGARILIASINSVQHAYVSRRLEFRKFFFSTLFGTIISGLVGIYMANHGMGVWALVGQYFTNICIDTIVLFFTVGWKPRLQFSFTRFKSMFAFGRNIMFTGFMGVLFNQLRGLVIGFIYNTEDLAFYNRGERFPTLVSTNIEASIDSVLFPVLSRKQEDDSLLLKGMRQFLTNGSYIIMPLMVGIAATGETLVKVLLTEKWLPCVPFLQIICIQQAFSVLNTSNLQLIKAKGKGKELVKLELIKKPIMLLILAITTVFSPQIMAVGSVLYEFIAAYINSKPTKTIIGYSLTMQLKDISPNLMMSIIMGGIVFFIGKLPLHLTLLLLIQVIVGVIVYVLLSIITKSSSFAFITTILRKRIINR